MKTNKTEIDMMRDYVRVSDMCDAYNKEQGTDIEPWECVKYPNTSFFGHPDFKKYADGKCKFAVAILEGRPVFVGDEIFSKDTPHKYNIESDGICCKPSFFMSFNVFDWSQVTWTTPTKKRTFTLNGVELPCPIKINPTDNFIHIGTTQFQFNNRDEMLQVREAITNILTAARDKEWIC